MIYCKQIIKTANGVTRYNVSKERFKKILIPIPPMEVQEEIVRILDKFWHLLQSRKQSRTKELELRRKQYDYYLHHLYGVERLKSMGAKIYPMGEVGHLPEMAVYRKRLYPYGRGVYPLWTNLYPLSHLYR